MKKLKQIIIISVFFLLPVFSVLAGENAPLGALNKIADPSGFNKDQINPDAMAENIGIGVQLFLSILGIIFIILTLYAGYNWMMAQGDKDRVEKAQHTIQRATIGLIIIIGSYAIWNLIFEKLLN
jgi:hypothetical protein